MIQQAYWCGEAWSIPVWCQDEAGPYQAIPQPGHSWQKMGKPALQPHEYIRGGTTKLLTLFRPQTGQVVAKPVQQSTNVVLHPWLTMELSQLLEALPKVFDLQAPGRRFAEWGWDDERVARYLGKEKPAVVRLALVWDNLAGHHSEAMVRWCLQQGVVPLYTPLGGSWLNLAESVQRILVRRALDGQHPTSAEQVMEWLAAVVRGWNADPTAFEWGGKRAARRQRARERRYALGGSGGFTRTPIPRIANSPPLGPLPNDFFHIK